jgi:hypothetical protein
MPSNTDIVNRALQTFGTRTTVTDAELAANGTNEAIQANLILTAYRDQLLRMAPWDCAFNYGNLSYVTSVPGTPENTTTATAVWKKGQPPPPWAYEFQYPVDCLRACFIIPAAQTGFSSGVPITTAVTGGAPSFWLGQPISFKIAIDQFYGVTAAVVVAGGTGYAVGDFITLTSSVINNIMGGAPAILQVLTLTGNAVATVAVVNQIAGSATPVGGSYFTKQANPIAQAASSGTGTGATFTITQQAFPTDQRIILTNEEFATLAYVKQIVDPNVMDPMFQEAWIEVLGAGLCVALTGDKQLANMSIAKANDRIMQARKVDGNEGLTVNDVTPDFIRIRGIAWTQFYTGPWSNYDWGSYWPIF